MKTTLLLPLACLMACPAAPTLAWAGDSRHQVVPGETLTGICAAVSPKCNWRLVQRLNHIVDPRHLQPGQVLHLASRQGRQPAPVELFSIAGQASIGSAAIRPGQTVAANTPIRTGEDGFVTLRLADGSYLTLMPQSQMEVESHEQLGGRSAWLTRLNLTQGRVDNQVAKQGKSGGYRVKTPSAVLAVRGTGFRAVADTAGAKAEVTEGLVAVTGRGRPVAVAAGQGLLVNAEGRASPLQTLLPPPDLSALPAKMEKPLVRFSLPLPQGATGLAAEVAQDQAFHTLQAQARTEGGELRFVGLADGGYWLRVRGVDSSGLAGRDATFSFVLKARPEPPFLSRPAAGAKLQSGAPQLAWSAVEGVQHYRVQVARGDDPAFSQPLASATVTESTFTGPDSLTPGGYLWRVASVKADGDQGPFSDSARFTLKPAPELPPPPSQENGQLSFAWSGQDGQQFDFQLARDAAFQEIVLERRLAQATIQFAAPASGRYYMRVREIDGDGFVGAWSSAQSFVVPARPWWLLLGLLPLLF